jgi:hypothetical protein
LVQEIVGTIIKIERVSDAAKPLTGSGSKPAIPLRIEGRTSADQVALEISPSAAAELLAELSRHLQARYSA